MVEIRYGAVGNGHSAWEVYEFYSGNTKQKLLYTFTVDEEKALCRKAAKQIKAGNLADVDHITVTTLKCLKQIGVPINDTHHDVWHLFAKDRAIETRKQLESNLV